MTEIRTSPEIRKIRRARFSDATKLNRFKYLTKKIALCLKRSRLALQGCVMQFLKDCDTQLLANHATSLTQIASGF